MLQPFDRRPYSVALILGLLGFRDHEVVVDVIVGFYAQHSALAQPVPDALHLSLPASSQCLDDFRMAALHVGEYPFFLGERTAFVVRGVVASAYCRPALGFCLADSRLWGSSRSCSGVTVIGFRSNEYQHEIPARIGHQLFVGHDPVCELFVQIQCLSCACSHHDFEQHVVGLSV